MVRQAGGLPYQPPGISYEMPRCHPYYLFKLLNKVKIIIKAHCFTDFSQAQIGVGEQFLGLAYSQLRQILGIGKACFIFIRKLT